MLNALSPLTLQGILRMICSDMLVKTCPTSNSSSTEWPSISITTGLSVSLRYSSIRLMTEPYCLAYWLSTTVLVTIPAIPRGIHSLSSSGEPASQMVGPRPWARAVGTGPFATIIGLLWFYNGRWQVGQYRKNALRKRVDNREESP